jgi:hypothetical protein
LSDLVKIFVPKASFAKLSFYFPFKTMHCCFTLLVGFTEQEWHSDCEFAADSKAFIFSLLNKEEKPFKVMCSDDCNMWQSKVWTVFSRTIKNTESYS